MTPVAEGGAAAKTFLLLIDIGVLSGEGTLGSLSAGRVRETAKTSHGTPYLRYLTYLYIWGYNRGDTSTGL